jgi:hypothetical protein
VVVVEKCKKFIHGTRSLVAILFMVFTFIFHFVLLSNHLSIHATTRERRMMYHICRVSDRCKKGRVKIFNGRDNTEDLDID